MSLAVLAATHGAGWEELPPFPVPNGGGICGVVGTRIVMIGGTHWEGGSKNWLRSIFQYDPERRAWTKSEDLLEPIAYGADFEMALGFGFLGGSDGVKAVKAIAMMTGEKLVTHPIAALPASIVLSAGGAIGSKFVIVGGTDDAANIAGVQRTTHVVESVNGEWKVTRRADFPGRPFAVAASAVIGDELFVFGGAHWDAATSSVVNTADAFAFSPATNKWRALKPLPTAARGISAVTLDGHRLYLAGGFTDGFSAEAWIYDKAADRYDPATPLPIAGMVSLVLSCDHLYSIAGEDKMKSRTNRCFRIPVAALPQAPRP